MKFHGKILRVFPLVTRKASNGEYRYIPIDFEWDEEVIKTYSQYTTKHQMKVNVMRYVDNFPFKAGDYVYLDVRFTVIDKGDYSYDLRTCNFITYDNR